MSRRRTFVELCLAGEAFLDEIDDYVDEWHDADTTKKIWRFLGMTRDEYALWVEQPEFLRVIVDAHRRDTSVADVLTTQRWAHNQIARIEIDEETYNKTRRQSD
jgi:hypothetical protein